jgi:dihydrofolate reductase
MHAGLIDEYRLMVFPVVLGDGARLFTSARAATVLRLHDSHRFASGTTVLTYHPKGT